MDAYDVKDFPLFESTDVEYYAYTIVERNDALQKEMMMRHPWKPWLKKEMMSIRRNLKL